MSIQPFKKRANGGTLYAVKKGIYYFAWCYRSEKFASEMDKMLSLPPPGSSDLANNWKANPLECTESSRETMKR